MRKVPAFPAGTLSPAALYKDFKGIKYKNG
jgi:hypothetical protein